MKTAYTTKTALITKSTRFTFSIFVIGTVVLCAGYGNQLAVGIHIVVFRSNNTVCFHGLIIPHPVNIVGVFYALAAFGVACKLAPAPGISGSGYSKAMGQSLNFRKTV